MLRIIRYTTVCFALAAMTGCVSTAQSTDAEEAKSSDVVCKQERVVGTHFPRTVCKDKQVSEQRRDSDLEDMRRWQRNQ